MSLNSNFDLLLREYAPNEMIENEVKRINWLLPKLKKDTNWSLGNYLIPVETAEASRFEWGALPAANDIPIGSYAKPYVSAPKQLLGSMIFDQADLLRHDGDMKKSLLSILPGKVSQFVERMNEQLTLSILGDGSICALTANGTAGGLVTVGKTKVTLFTEKQKIQIKGTGAAVLVTGYVRNIDVNAGTFQIYSAATGGAVVDISAHTVALAAKVYQVGATTERVTSIVDLIFSSANGGADSLYGGTLVKAASPVFQPYFSDISSATTGANFVSGLYDAYYEMIEMGRTGVKKEVVLPFTAFKAAAKYLEGNRKYAYENVEAVYGSKAIKLTGPDGDMVLRAARGIPQDKAMMLDYDCIAIASRGEMIKKANPMSKLEHFEIRATTGYQYIVDKMAEFEVVPTGGGLQCLGGLKIATSIS